MGISGLLPLIRDALRPINICQLANHRIAIDAYTWLHRGTYACARELLHSDDSLSITTHVDYCMQRLKLLLYHQVIPVVVFDGGNLPAKKLTENERQRQRQEKLVSAKEFEAKGHHQKAQQMYSMALDVTPVMAKQWMEVLRRERIEYVVAPYEADAQMAYMELQGHVYAVLTEDSDLIAFGCKRVIFKLERDGGCMLFEREKLASALTDPPLLSFSDDQFLHMCILSGCDYLPSVAGVGLKTAIKLLNQHETFERVIQHLRHKPKMVVPENYEQNFNEAIHTFRHQRVYDVMKKCLVPLTPFSDPAMALYDYIGPDLDPEIARGIAEGRLNPDTHLPFEERKLPLKSLTRTMGLTNKVVALPVVAETVKSPYFTNSTTQKSKETSPIKANPNASRIANEAMSSLNKMLDHVHVSPEKAVAKENIDPEVTGIVPETPPTVRTRFSLPADLGGSAKTLSSEYFKAALDSFAESDQPMSKEKPESHSRRLTLPLQKPVTAPALGQLGGSLPTVRTLTSLTQAPLRRPFTSPPRSSVLPKRPRILVKPNPPNDTNPWSLSRRLK